MLNLLTGILAGKTKNMESELKNAQTASDIQSANSELHASLEEGAMRTLKISRESQMVNCGMKYKVIVDGCEIGKIGNGGDICAETTGEAVVRIQGKGAYGPVGLSMRLKMGDAPCIHFTTNYGGSINVNVTDAVVLEKTARL